MIGHHATLTGNLTGVKQVIVDIDGNFGLDTMALNMTPVPEPAAIVMWGLAGALGLVAPRRRKRRMVASDIHRPDGSGPRFLDH